MQNPKMEEQPSTVSFCPSFNTYSSSDRLSSIAVRVTEEEEQNQNASHLTNIHLEEEEDDFEFVLVRANPHDCSTTGAGGDPMMMNSYPVVFPVFNRDLLLECENYDSEIKDDQDEELGSAIRLPLEKLFIEDRDPLSSSSSEADELEGIKPGTYCVWTPAKSPSPSPSPSPSRCKKSNSTGSSSSSSSKQKWRLRDLLHLRRSNSASDGKESVIFFNSDPSKSIISGGESNSKVKTTAVKGGGKAAAKEKVSAHEVFYVRNKPLKEGDKRRSYLPYRQGLVGFFSNVNGLGRSFPPF